MLLKLLFGTVPCGQIQYLIYSEKQIKWKKDMKMQSVEASVTLVYSGVFQVDDT